MAKRAQSKPNRVDWAELAIAAARDGRLDDARGYFEIAVGADPRNPLLRYNQAILLERRLDIVEAAAALSTACRLKAGFIEAALRLSMLFARYRVADLSGVDPVGLRQAMGHAVVDAQPLVEAAFQQLKQFGPLAAALAVAGGDGVEQSVAELCLHRTGPLLAEPLFLTALRRGVNTDPEIEPLLAGLRRALLCELPHDRFSDRLLTEFALALAYNARNCEYVWVASADETAALAALPIDHDALTRGDFEQGRRLLLHMLFRPAREVLSGHATADVLRAMRPRALRDMVAEELAEAMEEKRLAAGIETLAPISEPTSRKVADQYEKAPYPRWLSLNLPRAGIIRAALAQHVAPDRLTFMDRPFDVLIAGCGTGLQAIQSAAAYGPNARVVALDLSAASLAYARRKAVGYGLEAIRFVQGDILEVARLGQSFDVIECMGVLHHMSDPFQGWRALRGALKPGGLMQIALYSGISRRPLTALRAEPDFPGTDCSDDAARRYRRILLARPADETGASVAQSRNAYTLSEFRDLVLHVSEQQLDLGTIGRFMDENGLAFRGFVAQGDLLQRFAKEMPGEAWPGSLASWAKFEEHNPRSFDGMYRFWCEAVDEAHGAPGGRQVKVE